MLGDFNIDSKSFEDTIGNQGDMIKCVREDIISQGVTQCIKSPTRWPQGLQAGVPTTIDHHWSTAPEKLSEFSIYHMGSSDHALISVVRHARCQKTANNMLQKEA